MGVLAIIQHDPNQERRAGICILKVCQQGDPPCAVDVMPKTLFNVGRRQDAAFSG
jgi:hypothetical protein